ncbi:hypothetical protein [Comamonas aquatica]|uniref:hypothetical protein n=1 Tax=Comamonas aquatica TaxID=225991 RepID=UPI001B39A5A5|nr:hypothetical protein [Comamonas aquatica]QTX21130.1 hypothetical protein KAQ61_01045 [Comamonas aquatica]
MFIESLTPDQLVQFAQLVIFAAFLGALVGVVAVPLLAQLLDLLLGGLVKAVRGPGARVRDLRMSRRLHLTAAMTARRELRKLRHG